MRPVTTQPPQHGYQQSPYPQVPPGGGGKLDTADTFDRIFHLYGSQFAVLIGAALVVLLPIALLQAAAARNHTAGMVLLGALLGTVGDGLYTGTVVQAVQDMRDGRRDFGIPQLLTAAVPFILPIVLATIVFVIGMVVSVIGFVVGTFVFATFFCLYAPAIVIERKGVFSSLGRSADLVRGNAWRVFGVMLVTIIIAAIAGELVRTLAESVSDTYAGTLVGTLVGSVLTAPVTALGVTVVYFQLRDLREGTRGLSGPAPPPAL
jgi:hypothetical protein